MAQYKYTQFLNVSDSMAYDALSSPGVAAPDAGIYRCHVCGHEIAIAKGHVLPPQTHHQHRPGDGPIQWRLTVFAQH